ncbi:ABC transporter permease [Clostridium sp. D2Q-14]|uniref:ABC transporter permease n=1 Tax=Anaeromonas gelatinilytica TaxID=2683194 RepID=UPI00193C4EB3|nr:ABC transporter permease [Anaeromonas gelatinilytica]MBS4535219.1 ABC transporter permease [Anaeromonas gelatinilytica]
MFFDFIKRNSRRTRKENGIYFASLVVSVVAFYVILSLGDQNVMKYLKTLESDAVAKLLLMIPMLYMVSLFFVFFLVYCANKYQLQRRRHEFGIYLMMGMKGSKLFTMIMAETLWSGLITLFIGIPISLFLTELISLATSRLIGMDIIGYEFSISWLGLGLTMFGFIVVQILAVFILSLKMMKEEPVDFLNEQKEKVQKVLSTKWSFVNLFIGVLLLCLAYVLSVSSLDRVIFMMTELILLIGIAGTFTLFRGLGNLIGKWVKDKSNLSTGLFVFTGRQLQENVLHQWGSLAISSLLMLMAMIFFTYGISMPLAQGKESRSVDFTFEGYENSERDIISVVSSDKLSSYIKDYYPMKIGIVSTPYEGMPKDTVTHDFSWAELEELTSREKDSEDKEYLLRDLSSYKDSPYLISLSSYNSLLKSINKTPILLEDGEVALYSDEDRFSYTHNILRRVLKSNPTVSIDGQQYELFSTLYTSNIVADRAITLAYALIVPDDMYNDLVDDQENPPRWNMVLDSNFVQEKGLMQATHEIDKLLSPTGLKYESYLASMGRQLFYIVAGSYITFYLGVMFLIISNTVLGLKFLMQQRSTRHRYYTVSILGASIKSLCSSARTQIWWYFGLVMSVALISSIFGFRYMVKVLLPSGSSLANSTTGWIAAIVLAAFMIFEICYIWTIQRKSDEEIKKLKEID